MRQFKRHLLFTIGCFFLMFSSLARSHGGGVDNNGCHNDAKSGQRHCHDQYTNKQESLSRGGGNAAKGKATSFKSSTNTLIIAIQKELLRLGYFPGNTMGYVDDRTIVAIKHFQQDIGLIPTGVRNQELLKLLQLHYSND